MNWNNVVTVYLKELKDSLRDRRTLLSTIIIPTLVMPLLTFGVGKVATTVISKAQEEIPSVAILGGADSPAVVAALKKSAKLKVVASPQDWKQAIGDKKLRVAVEIPDGFEAQIRPRSGLAAKFGIGLLNSPGTIDADYRGEIKVIMINLGQEAFVIKRGMRIAQAVIAEVVKAKLVSADNLDVTHRGIGGFGHTGH